MSVYIKGMEMPTDCALMLKIFPDGRVGVPIHLNWAGTMVLNDAEAIHVPDHGRLIDADALMEHLGDVEYKGAIKRVLVQAPTVIPADKEDV